MFALEVSTAGGVDGQLDQTFGDHGVVKISFPNSSQGYLYAATIVNDKIEAAGLKLDR